MIDINTDGTVGRGFKRDFTSEAPNTKWLTDITEMKCKDGKLYLCAVLDCFNASVVGIPTDKANAIMHWKRNRKYLLKKLELDLISPKIFNSQY